MPSNPYRRPDGTPKNTGRRLSESVATVRVDDDDARSDYTIHVEHPGHDGGVRCFHRTCREMVVSGIRSHLRRLTDGDLARVEVLDEAGLGLSAAELLPNAYQRTGAFAPTTPEVTVGAE
jgi:hypothetical protein